MKNDIDDMVKGRFGLSIYSFFTDMKCYETMNFHDHRERFFQILEYLLKEKKIMLVAPGADVGNSLTYIPKLTIDDKEAQWDISPENAIQYFRDRWPKNITDSNDVELVYFLYGMPNIIWIADDGSLHAS